MANGQSKGFGLSQITKGCLYLLIASTSFSLVFLMAGVEVKLEIMRFAAATGTSVWLEFKFWQIFTSPFLEASFVSLLFQGFMLWMFLPTLERWWGTKRFLKFAAYTLGTGMLVGTFVGSLIPSQTNAAFVTGLDPLIYASLIAYGSLFANQQVQFFGVLPMTGRQLTIGISGFMLLMVTLGQAWAEGASFVSAMVLAWVLTNGKWTPKIWLLKRKQKRIRRHLKIVHDDDKPDKSGKPPKHWLN